MPFDRTGSEPFELDQAKIGQVKPRLGEVEGYDLNKSELKDVFGIQQDHFGKLPKTIIIPVLQGRFFTEAWYHVTGYLYEVEPEEWVPVVSHKSTMPASNFKTTYVRKEEKISETEFNAGTSAEISIEAGGSYLGVTASVKSNSEIAFKYKQSSTTTETLETKGMSGNEPIHQLCVYPILKGKAIRRQRIDYTINNDSNELKWTEASHGEGYWEAREVSDARLNEFRKSQFHPVPMVGNGLPSKGYILPLPWFEGNTLNFTTLMSRQSWENWYVYDKFPWESCNKPISIAAPNNGVAFGPMATWTTLPPLKE
ncbi:hypothetical protein N7522_002951 [Penicillium canescens]|nr:hypothetical protein N7522_002951 [Penicillium canescens]